MVVEKRKVRKTSSLLKEKYDDAKSKESESVAKLNDMKHEHREKKQEGMALLGKVKKCQEHLVEIALRPNLFTEEEFIDILIDAEKREVKPKWEERVASYEELKQRTKLVKKVFDGSDVFMN